MVTVEATLVKGTRRNYEIVAKVTSEKLSDGSKVFNLVIGNSVHPCRSENAAHGALGEIGQILRENSNDTYEFR